jgi:spore coat polysaccharide biosynthesis protein SpsF
LGIVQVPAQSQSYSALAGRRLGGITLLEWVVRRISDCTLIDQTIVLAPDERDLEDLSRAAPANIRVVCPAAQDELERFLRAASSAGAEATVHFRLDHPFVDPALTDRLVSFAQARGLDYAGYASRDFQRGQRKPADVSGEWCRVSALAQAERMAARELDRQHVTRFLRTHPRSFQLGWITLPEELDREDVRLTINVEEDWDHADEIVEALGRENLDWQAIVRLLAHQPAMRGRMARLNQYAETAALATVR